MEHTKQTDPVNEQDREEGSNGATSMDQRQQQIVDMGSSTITTKRGTIHTLTIVGQVEGHQILPPSTKSTKYEHVMPLLATIEESEDIDGLNIPITRGNTAMIPRKIAPMSVILLRIFVIKRVKNLKAQ